MSHYDQFTTTNQPVDVPPVIRGDGAIESNYDTVTSFTALAQHSGVDLDNGINFVNPNVPPLPQGGHLNTYSTLFTDAKPEDVLDALMNYFTEERIDYVRDGAFNVRCYPCFGQTQIPIEICTFSNTPSERCNKGSFALEFRNQSLDSVNFFNVFRTAKDLLINKSLIKGAGTSNSIPQVLDDDDFLPTLSLAAFDMSLLDDTETAAFAEDTAEDLTQSFQMLVNITNQEDSSIKTQAVRGIVDVMGKNPLAISLALESGAFDVLTLCIREAAQHLTEQPLGLDAASPIRDMCHHAVSGIANACEISSDARMSTIRSGALHALLLFVSSLADSYAVHCRELVRETLRAYLHVVSELDSTVMSQLLEKPLLDSRTCGTCLCEMITALENRLNTDCQSDLFLQERVTAIKRQLVNL